MAKISSLQVLENVSLIFGSNLTLINGNIFIDNCSHLQAEANINIIQGTKLNTQIRQTICQTIGILVLNKGKILY